MLTLQKGRFAFVLLLPVFLMGPLLWSLDRYNAIETLLSKEKLPRILNSEDLPDLNPNDPQPLFSPSGDFNQDGLTDVAIAGIYDLPGAGPHYFFLVAAPAQNSKILQPLYFKEYNEPVYIHKPGTTGLGDPGDQAFSMSLCANCDKGTDFYWDANTKSFTTISWAQQKSRLQQEALAKQRRLEAEEEMKKIPDDIIDLALRVVGLERDVQEYIENLKAQGRQLGITVEPFKKKKKKKRRFTVRLFERGGEEDIEYDTLLVDIKKMKILERKRKIKKEGRPPKRAPL